MRYATTFGAVAVLATLTAASARAQANPEGVDPLIEGDPLVESVRDGNAYVRSMLTSAAEQMSEEDYAFRPTPEVRSFGELLAHVAGTNYYFCAAAIGEPPPASGVEETAMGKEAIRDVLSASFDYCEAAFETASRETNTTADLDGERRSPMAVMNFRNYHALLHYGNVVTYMRLRGRVPPSSQLPESQ